VNAPGPSTAPARRAAIVGAALAGACLFAVLLGWLASGRPGPAGTDSYRDAAVSGCRRILSDPGDDAACACVMDELATLLDPAALEALDRAREPSPQAAAALAAAGDVCRSGRSAS